MQFHGRTNDTPLLAAGFVHWSRCIALAIARVAMAFEEKHGFQSEDFSNARKFAIFNAAETLKAL